MSADIDPNAGDWDGTIPEAPKGDPNAESIELPGYPKIYIPAGQTDVDVAFSTRRESLLLYISACVKGQRGSALRVKTGTAGRGYYNSYIKQGIGREQDINSSKSMSMTLQNK